MSNDEQRCVCVVEQWYVQNASILDYKVVDADPNVLVDLLIHNVNFFFVHGQSDLLLKLAYIRENIKLVFVEGQRVLKFVIFFEASAHQVAVNLQLGCEMTFVCFSIQRNVLQVFSRVQQDLDFFFC